MQRRYAFYEFFAGGGMARAGLGDAWACLLANDVDPKKAAAYRDNWGADSLAVQGVETLGLADLPRGADLAWASFPCQDLSLAGVGAGLVGERSGRFWPFWRLMLGLRDEGRAPRLIVLENVCGALSSHGGRDFAAICGALHDGGYRYGAVVIDAARFVPQSRPRLFIVAVDAASPLPVRAVDYAPNPSWTPRALAAAYDRLTPALQSAWLWWRLPEPSPRAVNLVDLLEDEPRTVPWNSPAEARRLIAMMSPVNRAKLDAARRSGRPVVGALYRRTRPSADGVKVQRAEVRFDDIAGCLRTPAGGSSRQLLLIVDGGRVRSRLISPRETARLMGLPDHYILPENVNEAYHLTGDGVVVPVVRHVARTILEPVLDVQAAARRRSAA